MLSPMLPLKLIGAALVLLGGAVTLGWVLKISELVRIVPGFAAMVFNTALCFLLLGAALMLAARPPVWRQRAQVLLGGLAALIAALTLSQDLFSIDIGIDHLFSADWLQDARPQPTRMAPNTATAFILSGTTLILLNLGRGRWASYVAQFMALIVILIGSTALLGYAFSLEFLFAWNPYTRMAVHTASGFVLLGLGLWACWRCAKSGTAQTDAPDVRIVFTGSIFLIVMALTAGITGFLMLTQQTEATLKRGLQVSLYSHVEVYRDILNSAIINTRDIAARLLIRRGLQTLNTTPNHRETLELLHNVIASYIDLNRSAVALYDIRGRRVAQVGALVRAPTQRAQLNLPYRPELLWTDGLVLHTRVPVIVNNQLLGTVVAEQPLTLLNKMFENIHGMGKSGEMVVCASKGDEIACFPTRLHPEAFTTPRRINGNQLAMAQALDGFDNVTQTLDYRGKQVIAAYGPIYQTGLGMVIKMDLDEIYQPILGQFWNILILLLTLAAGGVLLLRQQVLPLTRELVQSREEIRTLSLTDELTGLRNRRGFVTLAEVELALARRMKRGLAVYYADLDYLKAINDDHGHAEGDRALKKVADILQKTFRDSDIIARLGGDEFAILALETVQHKPELIIQRLETRLAEYNRAAGHPYALSLSMGAVYVKTDSRISIDEIMARADAEMYRVKQARRTGRAG